MYKIVDEAGSSFLANKKRFIKKISLHRKKAVSIFSWNSCLFSSVSMLWKSSLFRFYPYLSIWTVLIVRCWWDFFCKMNKINSWKIKGEKTTHNLQSQQANKLQIRFLHLFKFQIMNDQLEKKLCRDKSYWCREFEMGVSERVTVRRKTHPNWKVSKCQNWNTSHSNY